MSNFYYLSRFIGTGTELDAFRPFAESLGHHWGMIDLRPDSTRPEGWCFVCVDHEDAPSIENSSELIYLCVDGYTRLHETTLNLMKSHLGINFKSKTLAEILAEILLFGLMPGRGLRPDLDGNYEVNLNGLLWKATELEAFEFVGRLRESDFITPARDESLQLNDLRSLLHDELATLASIVEHRQPGWLDSEMKKVKANRSTHPLVRNFIEASELCQDSDFMRIHNSSAVLWIRRLIHDLSVASSHIEIERVASRLCNSSDCEPTKYELYVMASYLESGSRIEKTDSDSTGEFRILEGGQSVHVECKYKDIESVGPRGVKSVFDIANDRFREFMQQKAVKVFLNIECRTDPSDQDVPILIDCVSRAIETGIDRTGLQVKCGSKFQIDIKPSAFVTTSAGPFLPTGLDYGFTESKMENDSSGKPRPGPAWGIGWRVIRPGGWIRSVVDSVRQAASQVPRESPNLIYINVPTGRLGAVRTRIDLVAPAVEELLANPDRHTRVNAVILTGHATQRGWPATNVTTLSFMYRNISNRNSRNPLPEKFRVFGKDFTREAVLK